MAPTRTLLGDARISEPRPSLPRIARFYRASLSAAAKLRYWPIEKTVRSVQARRHANSNGSALCDSPRAKELTTEFNVLRSFFPRRYLCLFDSLALLDFLAQYELYPTWVFGVKLNPFGAHCWVQTGDAVVNDDLEYIRNFSIILTA
jgi:hypothetical protein